MSQSNEELDQEYLAAALIHLSNDFRRAASENMAPILNNKNVADILKDAARALEDEQKKNQELQRQVDALKSTTAPQTAAVAANPTGGSLAVLIDGSGSMLVSNEPAGQTILESSIEATLNLSKLGVNINAAFWSMSVQPIKLHGADVKAIEKTCPKAGTVFMSAVNHMKNVAATGKPQHFVILSDGDFAEKGILLNVMELLNANPKTTLDFVVIPSRWSGKAMEALAQTLKKEFPAQVSLQTVKDGNVTGALKNIAATRRVKAAIKPNANLVQYQHRNSCGRY